jgi:hypothetical protein
MEQAYRRYCQAAAVAFVLVTLYTVPTKLLQGRLGDDWAHSVLHLGSAVLAAYAGWPARSPAPARAITARYHLGDWGRLPGAWLLWLVHARAATGHAVGDPARVPENLFHLLLAAPALAIVLLDLRSARSRVPERG